MNICYGVVLDNNLPAYGKRRIIVLKTGDQETGETTQCAADGCTQTIRFIPPPDRDSLLNVTCTLEHSMGLMPTIKAEPRPEPSENPKRKEANQAKEVAAVKRDARGNCPHCDGPPGRGRGWQHTDICTHGKPVVQPKEPCPECGGPARGRGHTHTPDCSILQERTAQIQTREPCEQCGGPARGRGYAHTEDCPIFADRAAAQAAKYREKRDATSPSTKSATCDQCGGPARGRGFTHTDDCSIVLKRAAALASPRNAAVPER